LHNFFVDRVRRDAQDGAAKENVMSKPDPKIDPPKTDIPRPQAEAPRFDLPFEAWAQAARDNLVRLQSTVNAYWDELAGYENAMYERARAATSDLASLTQESIAYAAALTAEWRKMSIAATRRVADGLSRA
jgi:hypothetical protein